MEYSSSSRNTVAKKDDCRKPRLFLSIIEFLSLVSCFLFSMGHGARNGHGESSFESDLFEDAATYYLSEERSLLLVIVSALALGIGPLQVDIRIGLVEKTAVLICIWTGSLQARFSIVQIQAKKRGHGHDQGQKSSGAPGGRGAGNAGGNRGRDNKINHGISGGKRGSTGQREGNGDDDQDNNGRDVNDNVENGRNIPRPEERAVIFLPIITGSIAYMVSLNDAELSTTGRSLRHFSMTINLLGFICCAVVLWQPYTNPRVARLMNPRVVTILSRIGSALAVLGFLSTIAIDLPIYLSWISGLFFVILLAMFLVDMLA